MFKPLVAVLVLAQAVFAGVYITTPVATTDAIGGQILHVTWKDNGESPSLQDIGPSDISIYTGSVTQQTFLQTLASKVDVSKAPYVNTTIDPTIGPIGAYYFVKVQSLSLQDPNNTQFLYTAYSSKFKIDKMTGSFNATVLAQLGVDATASSSTAAAAGSKVASATTVKVSTAASTTAKSSGAISVIAAPVTALLALTSVASYLVL